MKRSFALAGVAMLALALTASLSMAQPDKGQPQSPPAVSQSQPPTSAAPATPATPATPAAPGESSAAPASPAAPAASAQPAAAATSEAPRGCRTRKEAGEPCACLSDPNRVGMSTAHPAGHNVCVRPD